MDLFTVQEAADMLGVSYRAIVNWVNDGSLRCYRIGDGRSIRFSREQIQDYLNNHETNTEPAPAGN